MEITPRVPFLLGFGAQTQASFKPLLSPPFLQSETVNNFLFSYVS